MRLLILAAAATLAISGAAMAEGGKVARHHHHYRDANASLPEGAVPADVLSAHDAHLENLRDSGYNPASDRDAAGNVKTN